MKKIYTIEKGTAFYVDPLTQDLKGPALCHMDVYIDAPAERRSLNVSLDNNSRLRQLYPCKLAGVPANVLIDTGASHNFMDLAFAKSHGFYVTPGAGSVH